MKKSTLVQKIAENRSKKAHLCHVCVQGKEGKDPKHTKRLARGRFCGKKWFPQEP